MGRLNKQLIILTVFLFSVASLIFTAQKDDAGLPPLEADAQARLDKSPRHGEWITYTAENNDKVEAWIVYPEIKEKAPVVIVIHEIFGLSDWIRTVADQLAKEGFIAIVPDFLSGKAPNGGGSKGLTKDEARALNSVLKQDEVVRRLNGAAKYATSLPAASNKYAVIGFCWGGATSFNYATEQPGLSAAVVYYGTSPAAEKLANVKAPILGLYGGNDNRVNATIEAAETELKRLKKTFEKEIYTGAGHGFLRQQDGMEGANMNAAKAAWPRTIGFLKKAFKIKITEAGIFENQVITAAVHVHDDVCCDE